MIQKLRRQFIVISVTVLSIAMLLLTIIVNAVNWNMVRQEIEGTVNELATPPMMEIHGKGRLMRGNRGKEAIYESRYFIVTSGWNGMQADLSHVSSYTEAEALQLAEAAISSQNQSGFIQECYFSRFGEGDRISILFLDCGSRLSAVRQLIWISVAASAAGILLAWLLMALLSRKAIQPILENSEKQKRFITDASHELKTPLSVISANMDVMAFDDPENEWVQSTRRQVGLMSRMVRDMVFLARADEETRRPVYSEFDLAKLLHDTADPFVMMAEAASRRFYVDAPEQMPAKGDVKGVERLISVLCDNAIKYSPEDDSITLRLSRKGSFAIIETENTPAEPISEEKLTHLFDRFYRADESRVKKTEKTGFGIGLAIALAVAQSHGGSAKASMKDGKIHIQCRLKVL